MNHQRREQLLIWLFGSRQEAHRVRNRLFAYLIVVGWGWFWYGVTRELSWWRQLGVIALFAVLPYLLLSALLGDAEDELRREREIDD